MDSGDESCHKEEKVIKPRLSLFNPNVPARDDEEKTEFLNEHLEKYSQKLTSEVNDWKNMYKEVKEQSKQLESKYKNKSKQPIDYSVFDEEDIEFLNDRPDFNEFVTEAQDLEILVKLVTTQVNQLRQKAECELTLLENAFTFLEKGCCEYKNDGEL